MKVEQISILNKYTNNIEILKQLLSMDDKAIECALNIYKKLESLQVPQTERDDIVKLIIDERLFEVKDIVTTMLEDRSFVTSLKNKGMQQIKKYVKQVKKIGAKIKNNADDEEIDAKDDRNQLTSIAVGVIKERQTAKIREILNEIEMPQAHINKIIMAFLDIGSYECRNVLYKYLKNKDFYKDYSLFNILVLIKNFGTIRQLEHLQIIDKLLNYTKDIEDVNYDELFKISILMMQNYNKLGFMLNKNVFRMNSIDEVLKLINLYLSEPKMKLIINKATIERLSYKQYVYLITKGELLNDSKMLAFFDELNRLIGEEENLYVSLLKFIDETEYETTVAAYLEACSTIEDFIVGIEEEVESTKNLTLETKLTTESK